MPTAIIPTAIQCKWSTVLVVEVRDRPKAAGAKKKRDPICDTIISQIPRHDRAIFFFFFFILLRIGSVYMK